MASHIPVTDWSCPDLGDAIGLFKQKMTLFLEDENILTAVAQARKICRGIGDEGLRRLNASGLTDDQKKNPVQNLYRLLQARTVRISGSGSNMWCGVFVGCCRQEL